VIRRHPFITFCAIVATMIASVLWFIQSPRFARVLKNVVARHLPSDMGVQGDFSELSIGLFPPSVSIKNPKVSLGPHNLINLPAGSSVTAQRIDLRFQLFQMLSGQIKVHEVAIVDGDVKLVLHAGKDSANKSHSRFHPDVNWDELLQIRAEAISIENTRLHLDSLNNEFTADLTAERLRLAQWKGKDGSGYELRADFKDINSSVIKNFLPTNGVNRVSAVAHVNAAGVQVDDILIVSQGLEVRASGQIKGNVLSDKVLALDSRVSLNGDLETISGFFRTDRSSKIAGDLAGSLAGKLRFTGRFRGDLNQLQETARAEGSLEGQDVKFKDWSADRVEAEAAYSGSSYVAFASGGRSAGRGGEISVTHAVLSSAETPRIPPKTFGGGGKVEIGAFKYRLGNYAQGEIPQPVTIPIRFERAHIHWLTGSAAKIIFPLDFRVSGPVDATFIPATGASGKNWSAQAKVGFEIEEFHLDNQVYQTQRVLHQVFNVKKFNLAGPLSIDSNGLKATNVLLSLDHTQLTVNGTVGPKTGYDLYGQGPADLSDFGAVAENPIRGAGTLDVHTHGPASAVLVDIDADLKDAFYLNLNLGDVRGRITWDDDPDNLIFNHIQAIKGETPYSVNGTVYLGATDKIDLNADFPAGNIHDVSAIFDNLVKDLWWFPSSLSGTVQGKIKITGGVNLNRISILSEMTGNNWLLMGERFRKVTLQGGFVKGAYIVSDFKAVKQTGDLSGKISYDADQRFDWEFKTDDLAVSDLDHIARLDVPIRGRIQLESHGHGKESSLQSLTQGSVTNTSVRGDLLPSSQFTIRTDGGVATTKAVALGGQGTLDFVYNMNPEGYSTLDAELHHLDFSPALLLLNPKLMQDNALEGHASGEFKIGFKTNEIEKATGTLAVQEYRLAKTGTSFNLVHPITAKMVDGDFFIHDLSLSGGNAVTTLSLKGRPNRLDGTVTGGLDLSVLEFVVPVINKGTGEANLDFTIEGLLKAPSLYGRADIQEGGLRLASIDTPIENISGALLLRNGAISVQNLQADLAGGQVNAGGTVEVFAYKYPTLDLKATLAGSRLKIYPFQYVKVRGDLAVTGEQRPYLISGSTIVDSAMVKEKVLGQKQGDTVKTLQYTPAASGSKGATDDIPLFKLKIDVVADRNILVQNDLFDAELKAHVSIVNTLDAPRILGTADMIQGKMTFKDHQFQVQSASANFDNPSTLIPHVNMNATTEFANTKVFLNASGRMNSLKFDLTSNPAMSESEILSLLSLGGGSFDNRNKYAGVQTDYSAVQQGEAAALVLQTMDFNRDLQDKTGFEIQMDESISPLVGQSIFNSKTPIEQTAEPKLIVRRRIGDKFSVSYGSTVGVGTDKESDFNAEYHLTPGLSAIGVYENYETQEETQLLNQNSYGLDFKLEKRFK
jgi:hypothetical protein